VRRHYAQWRQEHGLRRRCDNPSCTFHTRPLDWNGKELQLILDHINGNSRDNSPTNLRYLCPNCESQLVTRGGANRGKVLEASEGKYVLNAGGGRRQCHLFPETGHNCISGASPLLVVKPIDLGK
jgi:hypothetical protein